MGRKKGLIAIFSRLVDAGPSSSPAAAGPASPSWPWPSSCGSNPPTTSFRGAAGPDAADDEPCCTTAAGASAASSPGRRRPAAATTAGGMTRLAMSCGGAAPGEMYKTVNSVYFDSSADDLFSLAGEEEGGAVGELLDDDVDSFSTTTASEEWSEAVIRSLARTSTDRFFFDPGPLPPSSSSILAASQPRKPPVEPVVKTAGPDLDDDGCERPQQRPCGKSLAEGSVAVAVDSADPYGDFRASMEEMVAAHGLRDWAALEELLAWYLRVNGKHHHHLIVGAFVDLLLGLASSSSPTSAAATTTSSSGGRACTATSSTSTSTTTTTTITTTASVTAAAAMECGGGGSGHDNAEAASSSSSSCGAAPDAAQDDDAGVEEKASTISAASDDDPVRVSAAADGADPDDAP